MPNETYPTLQDIAADRDWWNQEAGAHYRELAEWLHVIARSCRLPYSRLELTRLARRYDLRADQLELERGLR
jgi:hypothetical protein